jgi:hypothetical protein
MSNADRTAWLAGLKKLHKVVVVDGSKRTITTIAKLTPTQIVLGPGTRFTRKDGWQYGGIAFDRKRIEPITPHDLDEAEATKLQASIGLWMEHRAVPLATLRKITALLQEISA